MFFFFCFFVCQISCLGLILSSVLFSALSILKPKKKLWFVLEESQCQLKFYNSEAEARKKPPIDQIELKGAAISLDLEQQNQFIIM